MNSQSENFLARDLCRTCSLDLGNPSYKYKYTLQKNPPQKKCQLDGRIFMMTVDGKIFMMLSFTM
jgi:hypothetical protein